MSHAIPLHTPRGGQGPDADEPLDPVEGADAGFPQTEAEEFRRDFTNDRAEENADPEGEEGSLAKGQGGEDRIVEAGDSDDYIVSADDLVSDPVPGAGEADQTVGRAVPSSKTGSLEALLAGVKARTTKGQAPLGTDPVEEGVSPLIGLLARVRKTIAESEQLKVDRKVLDAGGLTKAQREALRAKILRMEADVEWTSKACTVVIEHQSCSHCQTTTARLYGIFARQERKLSAKDRLEGKLPAERLVQWFPEVLTEAEAAPLIKLPREKAYRDRTIAVCNDCVVSQGFINITEIDWEKVQ